MKQQASIMMRVVSITLLLALTGCGSCVDDVKPEKDNPNTQPHITTWTTDDAGRQQPQTLGGGQSLHEILKDLDAYAGDAGRR